MFFLALHSLVHWNPLLCSLRGAGYLGNLTLNPRHNKASGSAVCLMYTKAADFNNHWPPVFIFQLWCQRDQLCGSSATSDMMLRAGGAATSLALLMLLPLLCCCHLCHSLRKYSKDRGCLIKLSRWNVKSLDLTDGSVEDELDSGGYVEAGKEAAEPARCSAKIGGLLAKLEVSLWPLFISNSAVWFFLEVNVFSWMVNLITELRVLYTVRKLHSYFTSGTLLTAN